MELAPGQHGLEQVAGVHGALGLTGPNDGVQLVDEEQDLALALADLLQHGLQPLLKLAPILGAGNQGAHVQGEDGLVLQALGHVAPDDSLGQALHDGGLAYAGLTDQDRVVLGLAGENADHVADLLVPADDRVHLLLPGSLYQIRAEALQGFVCVLRVVGGDALTAPNLLQGLHGLLPVDHIGLEETAHGAVRAVDHGQEDVLHGDELILHGLRDLLGLGKDLIHGAGNVVLPCLPAGAGDSGQLPQLCLDGGFQTLGGLAHALEELRDQSILLPQQGQQQMKLLDLLVIVIQSDALSVLDGLHGTLCVLVCIHGNAPFFEQALALFLFEC